MATVRTGNQPALLVVDVQVGVMAEAWDSARVVGNVARAVERAREQQVPVIWVQHNNRELATGSAPWQWVPQLTQRPGETVIHKQFNSAFEHTSLDDELARRGVTHIVLAGAESNWCIRATAYGALDRGYDLTLIDDAHTAGTIELPNGRKVEPASVVDDLNVAMKWLQYPGRTNGTASAAAIDFARPGGTR